MASEGESSLADSASASISTLPQGRPRTATQLWQHSRTALDGEPLKRGVNRIMYCRHCPLESTYSSDVSTNFRRHLQSKHQITAKELPSVVRATAAAQLQALYQDADSVNRTQELDTQVFQKVLDRDVLNKALVLLITVRNLPFRIVEWPEFHTFCQVLNPESKDYLLTAHATIPKLIAQSWQTQKDLVRKKLQSALSSIHLSLDIWTSPNRLLLLGICAHFVDQSHEKRFKALLALRTVSNHSGDK